MPEQTRQWSRRDKKVFRHTDGFSALQQGVGPATEAELVARLKQGDPAAFDAIYDQYRPRVFGFLARMCGDRQTAEDLLQETWLRLARNASRLTDDTRLGPWLFTVARNLVTSHYRWLALDLGRLRDLSFVADARPPEPTPFDSASAGETAEQIERALARMPRKYREVLLLTTVEQLAPQDAAYVVGIKPAALRQRLTRARAMLRDRLLLESEGKR